MAKSTGQRRQEVAGSLLQLENLNNTRSAEIAAEMVGKSDRTVWTDLIQNDGVLPESKQGKLSTKRTGVLWYGEELNKKAAEYVRLNESVKGTPNMTVLTRLGCPTAHLSLDSRGKCQ